MVTNSLKKLEQMSESIKPTGKERSYSRPKTLTAMTVSSSKLRELAEAAATAMQQPQSVIAQPPLQITAERITFCSVSRMDGAVLIDFNRIDDANALYDELTEWLKAKASEREGVE